LLRKNKDPANWRENGDKNQKKSGFLVKGGKGRSGEMRENEKKKGVTRLPRGGERGGQAWFWVGGQRVFAAVS